MKKAFHKENKIKTLQRGRDKKNVQNVE